MKIKKKLIQSALYGDFTLLLISNNTQANHEKQQWVRRVVETVSYRALFFDSFNTFWTLGFHWSFKFSDIFPLLGIYRSFDCTRKRNIWEDIFDCCNRSKPITIIITTVRSKFTYVKLLQNLIWNLFYFYLMILVDLFMFNINFALIL